VNHQLQQLFDFSLKAKGFFFGDSHLVPRDVTDYGLNGLLQCWGTVMLFKRALTLLPVVRRSLGKADSQPATDGPQRRPASVTPRMSMGTSANFNTSTAFMHWLSNGPQGDFE
jgi:hypothetical protein